MFRSYRVGTVYGIPFKLDVTFLLVLPAFAWIVGSQVGQLVPVLNATFGLDIAADPLTHGLGPWLLGAVAAIALFACVALHELGHSVVAIAYGYEIESITLWLLGGIAKPAELPREWVHEFWIAVAGPAVNVAVVALLGAAFLFLPPVDAVVFLVVYLAVLNAALAGFNMLPAFPLDGGRVLRALLARSQPYVRATRQAAAVGKAVAVLLGLVGIVLFNLVLVALALFVYIAATAESRQMMLDAAFEGVAISDVMTPAGELDTVGPDLPLADLLEVMLRDRHTGYPVLDGGEFVGIITLEDVENAHESDATVADAMTPLDKLEVVPPSCDVMDAFEVLGENEVGRLPVLDADGKLCGMTTRTDLMRAFKIVSQRQRFEDHLPGADAKQRFQGRRSDHADGRNAR